MRSQVVVVGSLNADFVVRVARFPVAGETVVGREFHVFPGGKGANQAYGVAKLGGTVAMVGQVGNDTQSGWLKQNLASAGVDVRHVELDQTVSSGIATITTDSRAQNQIIIIAGANGTFYPAQLQRCADLMARARVLLLQLEIPLETVLAAAQMARSAGAVVILDPAPAPAQALPGELLACSDYVTPNETELAVLTHSPLQPLTRTKAAQLGHELRRRGAKKVLVKLGAQGALLLGPDAEHFWPAPSVTAVDTTAAGDAFNAAFAFALARGDSEIEAGRLACAAAACSVTKGGAQPSMPTYGEAEKMLKV
jgi:ribokinase